MNMQIGRYSSWAFFLGVYLKDFVLVSLMTEEMNSRSVTAILTTLLELMG